MFPALWAFGNVVKTIKSGKKKVDKHTKTRNNSTERYKNNVKNDYGRILVMRITAKMFDS